MDGDHRLRSAREVERRTLQVDGKIKRLPVGGLLADDDRPALRVGNRLPTQIDGDDDITRRRQWLVDVDRRVAHRRRAFVLERRRSSRGRWLCTSAATW